jgi:hypothetical protein
MIEPENRIEHHRSLALIWVPILGIILGILVSIAIFFYQSEVVGAPLQDFDAMVVTDGFHKISLENGQHFDLSYEQNHDRTFEGTVRHISMDHEKLFPILSYDILVTSGDYANPQKVVTTVENHHFTWVARTDTPLQGSIYLLHTVPMDQKMEEALSQIHNGDTILVEGWDILRIEGYNKSGEYIGYWQDSGCNTTLVTGVTIEDQ